ncbi:unnamed protein product [Aureobasidium uvarum]|uniref:DUF7730 domain-containing protein n=1 Tax=Aureobasidium uvarum TaxID=2773716 RepID=A0A9N8PTV3_9PEZI|nr:unnamed protein product [Aureobasidium uvarum]
MHLRSGKRPRPDPPPRVVRRKRRPFRLLDLPIEIRLMIYGYAVGHQNVSWTVTYESEAGFMLELGDLHVTDDKRNIDHRHRSHNLLRTCRLISQEVLPILYNQTRFDIGFYLNGAIKNPFRTGYQLQLTSGRDKLARGLAKVVLERVKHIRILFRKIVHTWAVQILSNCSGRGRWLKSLRFTFINSDFTSSPHDMWYTTISFDFAFYRGNAVLEFVDANPTDATIVEFKERLKAIGHEFPLSIIKESDVSSGKKDWWSELND